MRAKRAKQIRRDVRDNRNSVDTPNRLENVYRNAKREYVRAQGRQYPKLRTSKRQQRIANVPL